MILGPLWRYSHPDVIDLDDLDACRTGLLERLRRDAFAQRPVTLASGRTSNFYIDCKEVTLDAQGHLLVGRCLFESLRSYEARVARSVAAVGGLTLGADPLASAVSMTSALRGEDKPAFIVRKEPKGHGTGAWLEGTSRLEPGAELAVLEDVVTSGGSALKAAHRLREAGFKVSVVLALVDRLEGGAAAIEAEGLELVPLFTRRDFMRDEEVEG